jgi:hypothetical protein
MTTVLALKESKLGEVSMREISPYLHAQGTIKERIGMENLRIPGHSNPLTVRLGRH